MTAKEHAQARAREYFATHGTQATAAQIHERVSAAFASLDAALSGARGVEAAVLDRLLQMQAETPQVSAAIAMSAAAIIRSAADPDIQNVFAVVADDIRPAWQRSSWAPATVCGRGERSGLRLASPSGPAAKRFR